MLIASSFGIGTFKNPHYKTCLRKILTNPLSWLKHSTRVVTSFIKNATVVSVSQTDKRTKKVANRDFLLCPSYLGNINLYGKTPMNSKYGTYEGSFNITDSLKSTLYSQYFNTEDDSTCIVDELDNLIFRVDSSGNAWDWSKKPVGQFRFVDESYMYWGFHPSPDYFPEQVAESFKTDPTLGHNENYLLRFERIVFKHILKNWVPDVAVQELDQSKIPNKYFEPAPVQTDNSSEDKRRFGNNRKNNTEKERAKKKVAQKSRAAQRRKK